MFCFGGKRGALQLSIEVLILIVIAIILLVVLLYLIRSGLINQIASVLHLGNASKANVSSVIP